MSGLYPEILFHFTTLKSVKGILRDGFRPSYAKEKIDCASSQNNERKFGVPIISFCDLRLSELPVHMKKYGQFGIGMAKEWGIKQGLNPVVYVTKESSFTNSLIFAIDELLQLAQQSDSNFLNNNTRENWEKVKDNTLLCTKLTDTLRYIKNYDGELIRKGKSCGPYRFANER